MRGVALNCVESRGVRWRGSAGALCSIRSRGVLLPLEALFVDPDSLSRVSVDTIVRCDASDDINAERRYFSYEHFYVIYCKFWELDADHDFMITKDVCVRLYPSILFPSLLFNFERNTKNETPETTTHAQTRRGFQNMDVVFEFHI
mgnify:CR=1 FL=1